MRIVAASLVLILGVAGAVAEDAALYPVEDCGQFTTQMNINRCAGANLEAANAPLNKIYQQVMVRQSGTSSKEQLKNVKRTWIAYRDKECAFEVGPQKNGGSIWPMEMSNCLEQMTAARIRELTKLRGCTAGVSACNPH